MEGNSLIGGIFFKNSRLDLGKALEAGLSTKSTDSTESWETCFGPKGKGSEGNIAGVPGMGSFKSPKDNIDFHEIISS